MICLLAPPSPEFLAGLFPSPLSPSLGIATAQVPDIAFGLVEPRVSHGPASQAVKVHLDVTNSLKRISCTAQLGVICRLAEVAVSPITCVIDEDVE